MHDYPALHAMAQIIRRGSFEAAADALGITPSAVSQRIKGLEDRLGMVLIHRGPPATGTEAGMRLLLHLDQVQLLEQRLDGDLRPVAGPAVLRIAVNADSLATWFPPVLTALNALYDLVIDDQDHARDWLRRGQVTAAITSESMPVPGCNSVLLGRMRYDALATPDFIERHFAGGVSPAALAAATTVTFNAKDALQSRWAQQVSGVRLQAASHYIPSSEAFLRAVELGLGWGMVPEGMAREGLAKGRLQPLVPGRPMHVPLYWQVSRAMAGALTPLTLAIRERAAAALRP